MESTVIRTTWQKQLMIIAAGGMLLQVGSCATQVAPLVLSLGESILLTSLLGRSF